MPWRSSDQTDLQARVGRLSAISTLRQPIPRSGEMIEGGNHRAGYPRVRLIGEDFFASAKNQEKRHPPPHVGDLPLILRFDSGAGNLEKPGRSGRCRMTLV
jgi:hypothetical protein